MPVHGLGACGDPGPGEFPTWVDDRDVPFFRITNAAFAPEFLLGATVLLASYDPDSVSDCAQPTLVSAC